MALADDGGGLDSMAGLDRLWRARSRWRARWSWRATISEEMACLVNDGGLDGEIDGVGGLDSGGLDRQWRWRAGDD